MTIGTFSNGRSLYGAGGSIHPNRAAFEFYATPPEATRALLSVEQFDGPVWEPACGDGAIAKVLIDAGHDVVSSDLIARGYGASGVDFLAETAPRARHIVTNPPYGRGLADRFVTHALAMTRRTGGSVAMLLNLASLAHPVRHALFTQNPPTAIYALDALVCHPNGVRNEAVARANNQRYCWVVWKAGQTGRPSFWWLSVSEFR